MSSPSTETAHTAGPLTFVEGKMPTMEDMRRGRVGIRAVWLADAAGEVISVVTEGADIDKCAAALKHAAHCTQSHAPLLASLKALLARVESDIESPGRTIPEADAARAAIHKATKGT